MENRKNIICAIILGVFLFIVIVGGFIFTKYMVNNSTDGKKYNYKNYKELRVDTKKDYIYLDDEEEIIEDIYKQNIVFNIKGFEKLNEELKQELIALDSKKETTANHDGISCENDLYSFSYRDYLIQEFDEYVSAVIINNEYYCESKSSVVVSMKSHIISKKTGSELTKEDLFTKYGVDEGTINEKIKTRLTNTQTISDDESEVIDINGTVNSVVNGNYNEIKVLSIGKTGKLTLNFIVKSNKINYNDSIELN